MHFANATKCVVRKCFQIMSFKNKLKMKLQNVYVDPGTAEG